VCVGYDLCLYGFEVFEVWLFLGVNIIFVVCDGMSFVFGERIVLCCDD